jgi:hypothetical protein
MDINTYIDRNILLHMLHTIPSLALKKGQIAISSNIGTLVVRSTGDNNTVSYSYIPSDVNDTPASDIGSPNDISERVSELAYFILGSHNSSITYSTDTRLKGGYTPVYNNISDVRYSTTTYGKNMPAMYPGRTASLQIDNSMPDVDDDYLDINTFAGGNAILMGGSQGIRGYDDMGRQDGTIYGNAYDIQEWNLPEEMYGGKDVDYDYDGTLDAPVYNNESIYVREYNNTTHDDNNDVQIEGSIYVHPGERHGSGIVPDTHNDRADDRKMGYGDITASRR